MRPVDRDWSSKSGVDASRAKTYGLGGQHVYCYSFNSRLELAHIKQSLCCSIKVGMVSGDPIDRIWQQISASKTAISEAAVVLLIFQTNDCRHLERWLHKKLQRDTNAHGREWFLTNENELVRLFRTYAREYS